MRASEAAFAIALLLLGAPALAESLPPRDPDPTAGFARRLPGARGVSYIAEVAPGLYRGGVPNAEGVAYLKSLGVRTIINLRHFHGESEGKLVRAAGMRYERIPLASSEAPSLEQVRRFLMLVTDPGARPIYVHCLHGVDRTGALMAAYRMEVEGWSNARALEEMIHLGAHSIWRDLKTFVRQYRSVAAARKDAPAAPGTTAQGR